LNYDGVFPSPNPYLRQEYDLNTRVAATGLRFVTADGGIAGGFAIDEIEVYGTPVPEPGSVVIWTLLGAVGAAFVWRRSQKRTVA
ncbi:MAG: PEP-CTERM sorting domain-containing protein, partial [Planctomycetales bacterium]|nr:PEP-CTERM sorting domain-containing protein [Planctomycetales bacterium]